MIYMRISKTLTAIALTTFASVVFISPSITDAATSARTPNTWNKISSKDTQQRDGNLERTTSNGGVFIDGAEYKQQRSKDTDKNVRDIHAKSGLKEDVLYDLFDKGFTKEEVKNIAVVKALTNEDVSDIANTYNDTNKELDLLLNSYQISKSDFTNRKNEMFDTTN